VGFTVFFCRRAPGRSARHHALNELVARCFALAGTPVTKEPTGLFRTDGKRPDGLTLVPWQSGKSLCWDVTVTYPLAESWVIGSALEAGAAAEVAASRKEKSMLTLVVSTCVRPSRSKPWAYEQVSLPTLCESGNLGRKISSTSGDDREGAFLFCREFRCWCNATTLSCYMTPCQPRTARTDDLYPILYYVNFKLL